MNNEAKTFTALGLSIIFLVSFFVYWYKCNASTSVDTIGTEILTFVMQSTTTKYTDANGIERTKVELVNNKYAKGLIPNSNSFFALWQKDTLLQRTESADFTKKIKADVDRIVAVNDGWKSNQMLGAGIISGIFILFTFLAFTTNLLRDPVGDPKKINNEMTYMVYQKKKSDEVKPSFSLSRTQLALWLTIIGSVYCYAVFWDNYTIGDINATALILMGISAGTFAVGAILDTTEIADGIPRNQDYPSSGNFFTDILSDKDGISVQRFQNVVWTVIAIFVYFYRYNNPPANVTDHLPVLDSTLLALTGISSATYLTLKTRENPKTTNIIIKVKLLLAPGTPQPWATAISNSVDLLKTVSIELAPVGNGPALHAVPSVSGNPWDFEFAPVEPEQYRNIKVTWKGTVPGSPTPDKEVSLEGTNTEVLDVPKTITVSLTLKP